MGWKQAGFLVVVIVTILLGTAFVFQLIPRRMGAIGILSWFVVVIIYAAFVKSLEKKQPVSAAVARFSLDDKTQRGLELRIRIAKAWIGILLICLPLGIANGIVQRLLLPTFVGVGINFLMIYVAVHEIKRMRKLIDLSTQQSRDIQ